MWGIRSNDTCCTASCKTLGRSPSSRLSASLSLVPPPLPSRQIHKHESGETIFLLPPLSPQTIRPWAIFRPTVRKDTVGNNTELLPHTVVTPRNNPLASHLLSRICIASSNLFLFTRSDSNFFFVHVARERPRSEKSSKERKKKHRALAVVGQLYLIGRREQLPKKPIFRPRDVQESSHA